MNERAYYLELISKRGDAFGGHGGTLSLLEWCNKNGLCDVTEEEVKAYWLYPESNYTELIEECGKQGPSCR